MPKTEIDYSNTIIYKITCKDKTITDVYVGHTTNFVQRKHAHKQSCINNKTNNYKCKLYEVIRANGGWANWHMEILNFFNCADHYEARKKEQEYFNALNATLNSIEPFPKPKIKNIIKPKIKKSIKPKVTNKPIATPVFFCKICNINFKNQSIENHNNTNKHIEKLKKINENIENPLKFNCEICQYSCRKASDLKKHLASLKHIKGTQTDTMEIAKVAKEIKCQYCAKHYNTNSGLWKHNKICKPVVSIVEPLPEKKPKLYEKENVMEVLIKENQDFKHLILEVVKNNAELQKQNQDFQKQMLELYQKSNSTVITNSHNNNKTFNLQVFLNEQCKDAMNIMDFVNSMTLELSDLEDVGTLGYVEGISNIVIRKLGELDIYKRPIHCSDGKREIMYVKDDNVWEKENATYDKLRLAIKHVTYKNSSLLVPWSQANPNCMNTQHHLNDVYVKMIGQAMGGKGEFVDSENKIMKKIAKAVLIDKL
jgi:hypothetical protein